MLASPALDRFAPAYIPQWQRPPPNAQEQVVPLHVPPQISFKFYASTLYPGPLLEYLGSRDADNRQACEQAWVAARDSTQPRQPPLHSIPPATPSSYSTRWLLLLAEEYNARLLALQQCNMYQVQLVPIPSITPTSTDRIALFSLSAPHIRENYPPVSLNDTVWLRQLRPWDRTLQGCVIEARVHSLQRVVGEVILRCDGLALPHMWESGLFSLQWVPQERHFTISRLALEFLHGDISNADTGYTSAAKRWLFPDPSDWDAHSPPQPGLPPKMSWVDPELNSQQKLAVESIVFGRHTVPYLISGPPGTGKTKTIVEAVFQILRHHPRTHILVCGASNSSADTLASRLSHYLAPDILFRLNDPSRSMDEVRINLQRWCWSENGVWALPSIKTLLSKRVIVTSCADSSLLSFARCTNSSLGILEDHFQSHLYAPDSLPFPSNHHFGFLLVDEAAQASEAEICVPLAVVSPHPSSLKSSTPTPHITICGDSRQLGPRIESEHCRNHDMDVSLLERLFGRDLYRENPFARGNLRRAAPHSLHQTISTPFCNLTINYRSHPAILMIPSTLFYDDTLIAGAPPSTISTSLVKWPTLTTDDFPLLFVGTSSPEQWTDERLSYYNTGEINEVKNIVTGLLGIAGPEPKYIFPLTAHVDLKTALKPPDISVISPFREQVWQIRVALRTMGLGAVDVGDVESLQGAENRVVIISTVRSSKRFLPEDQRLNRGIIFEAKRFNVALTRAKELLVIVGNGEILKEDPWWKQMLTFAMRNNAYRGPPIPPIDPSSAEAFSRLEEEWSGKRSGGLVVGPIENGVQVNGNHVDDNGGAGAGTEADTGYIVAGSVVRETLREDTF